MIPEMLSCVAIFLIALVLLFFVLTAGAFLEPALTNVISSSSETGASITGGNSFPTASIGTKENITIDNATENITKEIADAYIRKSDASNFATVFFYICIGLSLVIFVIGYTYYKFFKKKK